MPSRSLPARPHLDHLKNEAKALHKAFRERDEEARRRVREVLGDRATIKLTDAQRVLGREYGFPTWARLTAHVKASLGVDEAVTAFLTAVQQQNTEGAKRVLRAQPGIARQSLHVAAALGLAENARALIDQDRTSVSRKAGDPAADALLFLCFSPFHRESPERDAGLLATTRLLLDAGADPNTRDGQYGVPALYGVTGMHNVLPIAKVLLDAGANPTDGESVFHAAESFHEDALDLLLAAGADLNHTGEWGNTALYFLLRWHDVEREDAPRQGLRWLLEHGADPNVVCGKERENSLHVAARRGQSPAVVRQLLDHGADVHAKGGDGSTAWLLARRGGFDEIATLLESAGAETRPLSRLDILLAACGRGDAEAARRLTSPELVNELAPIDRQLLPDAAATDRSATVAACIAAGFPVDTTDGMGATALHHVAIHGRAELVRALLAAGAPIELRDRSHDATPLGWAVFGADHVAEADGDYVGCVNALIDAGATAPENEHARHPGVREALRRLTAK